jgi:hypothetical protein
MAKTYIQLHPSHKIVILDGGSSLGGTWSKERIYPGLKTNNTVGWLEFPDMPITPGEFDVQPRAHIKSEVVNEYLEVYAKRFHVQERIRLRTKVSSIEHLEKDGGGWSVTWVRPAKLAAVGAGVEQGVIHSSKLVIATGHTSEPLLPHFKGQETLQIPIFHTKDWAEQRDLLKSAKETVVLGGGKSAFDAAYMFADAGIKTHMVIRASGRGPCWMAQYNATPLKISLEVLATTRLIGLFSPCIWAEGGPCGLARRFLHGTWLGQKITSAFWGVVQSDTVKLSGLQGHPETERLMPWSDFFWSGTSCSILNYDKDFFQFVRNGLIEVHIADIESLNGNAVVLSTGESLKVDAIVCATSWKDRPAFDFLPAGSDAKLGLPHYDAEPDRQGRFTHADEELFAKFPKLRQQPVLNKNLAALPTSKNEPFDPTQYNVPWLLYRFMVPPAYLNERSIAFVGVPLSFNQGQMSTAESLWITAYFDGRVEIPTEEQAAEQTVLHARHARWRNPAGYGASFPDWIFDTVPYLDMVFKDIGVSGWKKTWLADLFTPYRPSVFAGVVEEYERKTR